MSGSEAGRSRAQGEVEGLLRRALAPVEPPADLSDRLRSRLETIRQGAAEELEGWELAAMRDPRNWVRPAIAVLGGAAAGAGLVLLGVHQRRERSNERREGARRSSTDLASRSREISDPR